MTKEKLYFMYANDLESILEEFITPYQIVRDLISLGYDYDNLVALGYDTEIIEEAMNNDMNNEE
jgi:hypothetical protein